MKLTHEEERLIKALREIDRKNPSGSAGYSETALLQALQRMVDSQLPEAEKQHNLFLQYGKRVWLFNMRNEKGLTQKQIAGKLGISEEYYAAIEKGERKKVFDVTLAARLSHIFGISLQRIGELEEYEEYVTHPNLRTAMSKKGVSVYDLAQTINTSVQAVRKKLACKMEFTFAEVEAIHKLFPEYAISYLFALS